jgi:thiol-disulfide isomerase/thioredoxin
MSEQVAEISAAEWDEKVLRAAAPVVVVDFYSTECPPCEALAPRLEQVAAEYAGRVAVYKLFRQGNREKAVELGVLGSPTLVFFQGGEEAGGRLTGTIRPADIRRQLDALLAAAPSPASP